MCECTSIMPGVTYLPVPSMTRASTGALMEVPTAAIFPSRSRTDPFWIEGPAAVMIVALRINVVRRRNGWYVLGKGSALGIDVPPGPGGAGVVSELRAVESFGCWAKGTC